MQRSQVRTRRLTAVLSVIGGAFVYWVVSILIKQMPVSSMGQYSLFFGDISHWPSFIVRSFWPLDLVANCLFLWLTMYIVLVKLSSPGRLDSAKSVALWVAGGFGGIGGVFMSSLGWYVGLEGFILFSGSALLLIAVIAVVVTVIIATGLLATSACDWLWRQIRHLRVVRPFVRLGNWLAAKDVPETSSGSSDDRRW